MIRPGIADGLNVCSGACGGQNSATGVSSVRLPRKLLAMTMPMLVDSATARPPSAGTGADNGDYVKIQSGAPGRTRWALITVTFNSAVALEEYWTPVARHRPSTVEWVVVDNNSSDRSREVAARLGARVIRLGKNVGFSRANNIGFGSTDAPYVAFVNPDVTPCFESLSKLSAAIDASPDTLVAPQLVNSDGTLQPNGRGKPYLWLKVLHRLAPRRVETAYRRYAKPGEAVEVDWLTGAVIAGSRERLYLLGAAGPWDEKFFVYYEDTDLGLRNLANGGRNALVGDANWIHGWDRATTTASLPAWRNEIASLIKFYYKYPRYLSVPSLTRRQKFKGSMAEPPAIVAAPA